MNDGIFSMTAEVIKKGFKNRSTIGMAIIAPIVAMIILSYLISVIVAVEPAQIGIINLDKGMGNVSASNTIIDELRGQENITLITLGSEADVEKEMKEKQIDGALVFGENFTIQLVTQKDMEINLFLEGTDQAKSALITKSLSNALQAASTKLQGNGGTTMNINSQKVYGNDIDTQDMVMVNIIALITFILSTIISTLVMLNLKKDGIFSRNLKSPIKAIMAYLMGISVFSFIIALVIFSYALYLTGITIEGNTVNSLVLTLFIALIGTSIGIFVTSITRKDWQSLGLLIPIIVLQYLFGGIIVAVSKFDYFVQLFSYMLPMTYSLDAIKGLAIRNFGWGDIWLDLVALFIMLILLLAFSVIGLNYQSTYES
jgi:ABC-type multidrug transport system permease subunit